MRGRRPYGASLLDTERATIANVLFMQPATHSGRTAAKAVIFDLDGVLVWSVPMHHWAFHKTFAAEGRDFPLDEYLRFAIGAPREVVIRTVMGELPAPEMKRLMDEKERYVRIYLDERGLDAIPGALQFVHEARQRALKTAVASASRTPEIILDAIAARGLFDAVVGRGRVARSKPHPDVYLLTAETLGVAPKDCIVIEDSSVGVEAARAAGMRVIALTTTEPGHGLSRADAIYAGFHEIPVNAWLSTDSSASAPAVPTRALR